MVVMLRGATAILLAFAALVPQVARPGADPVILVGAGDIASCESDASEATARLLDGIDGVVFALGDNVLDHGSADEYAMCYDPTWGRHRERTRPVPGNHDYETQGAAGYFGYFGDLAGAPGRGWYAYDLGDWHVVALNSNCGEIGGCGNDSEQLAWLDAVLGASPSTCTVAYMHHPRFSSTPGGDAADLDAIWDVLYRHGVEIVLSGHAHTYERFAAMEPDGDPDPNGIVQFVVGTGGNDLHEFDRILPHSLARNNEVHGVLQLTLEREGYAWEFVPVEDGVFTDAGQAGCHGRQEA